MPDPHIGCFVLWQLESLRSRLDEREELLKQKEKKLLSVSSEHSENSYAVENLQSVLSTKERQITSLKQKVKWSFTYIETVVAHLYNNGSFGYLTASYEKSSWQIEKASSSADLRTLVLKG